VEQAGSAVSGSLTKALKAIRVSLPTQLHQRGDLYWQTKNLIDRLTLSDSNIFSYVLNEGEYTAPVQVYRYQTETTFFEALADKWLGVRDNFKTILDALFPSVQPSTAHPGYRVLMSYMRPTP